MGIFDFRHNTKNPYMIEDEKEITYEILKRYYDNSSKIYKHYKNNNLYIHIEPVRTCVHRSVEFFVSKVASGDAKSIKIVTDNQALEQAIRQVWKWSNFSAQKQVMVRYDALFGNLFVKVEVSEGKVYFVNVDPNHVTDFEVDQRGYLTKIRLDIPTKIDDQEYVHVELWDKKSDYMGVWESKQGVGADIDQLGDPKEVHFISDFGFDFIPFVHIKFVDTGDKKGDSCVKHAISKIDQANKEATRLSEMLLRFNKPTFVMSRNAFDKDGKPLPAPKIKNNNNTAKPEALEINQIDESVIFMDGVQTLEAMIPNINYADALSILKDLREDIEQDLPELRYYSIKDSSMSGKAIRLLLSAAIDRAEECRGNFVAGVTRLDEMAITIAQAQGIFSGLGSFESGDFEHELVFPEMFPVTVDDMATTLKTFTDAGLPLQSAMQLAGFSEDETLQAVELKTKEENLMADILVRTSTANMQK